MTFRSLLTEEEVNLEKERLMKSKYQQLDLNNPTVSPLIANRLLRQKPILAILLSMF